jgi:hypothetical protein
MILCSVVLSHKFKNWYKGNRQGGLNLFSRPLFFRKELKINLEILLKMLKWQKLKKKKIKFCLRVLMLKRQLAL